MTASLVSGSQRAITELGWQPRHSTMAQMIADAWAWHQGRGFER
jgi:UDP-glucose 4-epimerase